MVCMGNSLMTIDDINKLDETAFHWLYKQYYKALVGYAIQIVGEKEVAEDVVAELFSGIIERRRTFLSMISLKVYLFNSVRNASLDYLRHKDVEQEYIEKMAGEFCEYPSIGSVDDEAFDEEVYRQLFLIIDTLPDRCREIFLMHMDGKKNAEIADILQLSLETVKTQKRRAMAYLRKKLDGKTVLLLDFLLM